MKDGRFAGLAHLGAGTISRRIVMHRLGAGGAAAAAGLALGRGLVGAQSTPVASPTPLPPPLDAWVAAWEAGNTDQIASYYAEQAVYTDVVGGATFQGRAMIQGFLQAFFGAFSNAKADYTSIFAAGDRAAGEWTFTGNYSGQYPGFPPGTGQPVAFRGAAFLTLQGGAIVSDDEYVDYLPFLRAVGVLSGGAATPSAGAATPSS